MATNISSIILVEAHHNHLNCSISSFDQKISSSNKGKRAEITQHFFWTTQLKVNAIKLPVAGMSEISLVKSYATLNANEWFTAAKNRKTVQF